MDVIIYLPPSLRPSIPPSLRPFVPPSLPPSVHPSLRPSHLTHLSCFHYGSPESLGIASGAVCLICITFCQLFFSTTDGSAGEGKLAYDAGKMVDYYAALLSMCMILFFGFVDDVLEVSRRLHLLIPLLGCLPLLVSYAGGTSVVIPIPCRALLATAGVGGAPDELTALGRVLSLLVTIDDHSAGAIVDIGVFYKVYFAMVVIFCTNSINILAGINGLEVGQSVVIGIAILAMNLLEIYWGHDGEHHHLFSATIMIPFVATSLSLLHYNWWPCRVFVGDSFTQFAGMAIAVSAILGHFSKTVMVLLLPQLINFAISLPQLFGVLPCPRHRLPRFDPKDGLMHASRMNDKDPKAPDMINLTLINVFLVLLGPMREDKITLRLLYFQAFCCIMGLVLRYSVATVLYDS